MKLEKSLIIGFMMLVLALPVYSAISSCSITVPALNDTYTNDSTPTLTAIGLSSSTIAYDITFFVSGSPVSVVTGVTNGSAGTNNTVTFADGVFIDIIAQCADDGLGLNSSARSLTVDTIEPFLNTTDTGSISGLTNLTTYNTSVNITAEAYDVNLNTSSVKIGLSAATNASTLNGTYFRYGRIEQFGVDYANNCTFAGGINITACDLAGNCNSTTFYGAMTILPCVESGAATMVVVVENESIVTIPGLSSTTLWFPRLQEATLNGSYKIDDCNGYTLSAADISLNWTQNNYSEIRVTRVSTGTGSDGTCRIKPTNAGGLPYGVVGGILVISVVGVGAYRRYKTWQQGS